MNFFVVFSFYVIYRLIELYISKKNERSHNYVEVGKRQRYFMVALHVCWYLALIIEYSMMTTKVSHDYYVLAACSLLLVVAIILRHASMYYLGNLWSTKVLKIPTSEVVRRGVYKYFNNPNYLGVVIELFVIPFLFGLYVSAIVFSILNLVFLYHRIALEKDILELRR